MPKLNKPPVSVVGLRRIPDGTEYTLSDGTKVVTRLHTTLGFDAKLKDAPIYLINHQQYANQVPPAQRKAWLAKEYEYLAVVIKAEQAKQAQQQANERRIAEILAKEELEPTTGPAAKAERRVARIAKRKARKAASAAKVDPKVAERRARRKARREARSTKRKGAK